MYEDEKTGFICKKKYSYLQQNNVELKNDYLISSKGKKKVPTDTNEE